MIAFAIMLCLAVVAPPTAMAQSEAGSDGWWAEADESHESGAVTLSRGGQSSGEAVSQLAVTRFSRGTSYVSSEHRSWIGWTYNGKAKAAGNLYNGNYVYKASFVYRRDGEALHNWVRSFASSSSDCNWSPGPLKEKTVRDGLTGTTTFHYDFGYVDGGVC